jgi:hypothetical protein
LGFSGNYYQNAWGQNEKWFSTPTGFYFCILPNGELRRWTGNMSTTLQAANLVATLDTAYHTDPSLLWNAKPQSAAPSLAISGNQLTIAAPAGITDIYQIEVSVSDGVSVATRTFALTVRSSVTPPPDNSGLVGDFNGDGRQDSAEFKADGSLWISLNGSAAKTLWAQWSAATYWTSLGVMDVNGDGRDDIVGLNKNGKYYIAFSTGTNFSTQLWTSTTPPKDS